MMKGLDTSAIPSIQDKFSTAEFEFRRATEDDLNEDYFGLLSQLTNVGEVDLQKAKAFYAEHLKTNPMFFLFVICVLSLDNRPKRSLKAKPQRVFQGMQPWEP